MTNNPEEMTSKGHHLGLEQLKPEDLTLEQVKEQLALYTRQYHNLRKPDEDYIMKKRARALRYARKKRQEKLLSEGKAELDNAGNFTEPEKNM